MIHRSLQVKWNVMLIAIWAGAVLFCVLEDFNSHWKGMLLGSVLGLITGFFQLRGVQAQPERFLSAKTALDVRSAFTASKPGDLSLTSNLVSFIIIMIHALFFEKSSPRLLPAYSAFLLFRECFTLKACWLLQRTTKVRQENAAESKTPGT